MKIVLLSLLLAGGLCFLACGKSEKAADSWEFVPGAGDVIEGLQYYGKEIEFRLIGDSLFVKTGENPRPSNPYSQWLLLGIVQSGDTIIVRELAFPREKLRKREAK